MKTAEDWTITLGNRQDWTQTVREIQLDAMKEGARRAAEKTIPPMRRESEYEQYQQYDQICEENVKAILTIANNWTEKDL